MRPGLDALRELTTFACLSNEHLTTLNEVSDLARVGPNETLLTQGQTPAELMFLVAGAAIAMQADDHQREATTDVLLPGSVIGGPCSMLSLPSELTVRTIASSRLIIIPAAALRAIIDQDAETARLFFDRALRRLYALQTEIAQLKLRSSAQRLARFLLALAADSDTVPARFVLPFEKQYLAGKIGCSQENLSRAFGTLRAFGVESQRGVVVIRDIPGLQAFVGVRQPARAAA